MPTSGGRSANNAWKMRRYNNNCFIFSLGLNASMNKKNASTNLSIKWKLNMIIMAKSTSLRLRNKRKYLWLD